jgi:IPT/TIG domain
MVRRSFTLTSAIIAALTVAWSSTPVAAGAMTSHGAIPSTPAHARTSSHAHARTLAATTTVGSLPQQLSAFSGGSQLAAMAAAGSGNSAVTTPADPSIAVGPTSVVETVNSALFVYGRTGGTPTVFSINTMINNPSGWAVRYPHVVYDPFSGRFILMVLQFDVTTCASQVVVMVSQANPLLLWTTRGSLILDPQLQPPPGVKWLLGDVSLAMTATVVVESSGYQACTPGVLGALVASQTDVIQRADLVNGTMTVNSVAFQAGGPIGVQPVMALGLTTVAYEIANDANCSALQAGTVAVFTITGTPDGKNVANGCSGVTSSFSEPSGSSVPPAAPQAGTSATLQTHDDRFLSAVWANNVLWASGGTGCTPSGDSTTRACLNVVHAAATTAGAVSAGTQLTPEGVSGSYLYYPALAVDPTGNVIVTFDESSASSVESMMLASITGGSTWSSSFATLDTSTTFYSPGGCTSCSWGDYSAAVQDPGHPTDVWVTSEDTHGNTGAGCATANSCWNTYIARFTFAAPAVSSLSPSSGPAGGGQNVTVFGSDFASSTTATFGPAPIAISHITPDSFTLTTPAAAPPTGGFEHVVATDPLGSSSATSPGSAYLFIPLANYTAVTPFRVLDTRQQGPALGPGVTRVLQIAGVGTHPVPANAVVAVVNVTAVAGSASSLLSVYPDGAQKPGTSALNFKSGAVTSNLVTVALGTGVSPAAWGAVNLFNAAGVVNVVVDVEGYFMPPVTSTPAGEFHPIPPTRVCDTRYTTYACHGAIIGGTPRVVTVAQGTIPNTGTAAAAVLNLTAVAGSAGTYLIVYPTSSDGTCATGKNLPVAATINVNAGDVAANRVMVLLGPATSGGLDTSVCVFSVAGSINVVLDANGWIGNAGAVTGYQFQATVPTRICDTRAGSASCTAGALGAGVSRLVGVAGQGGVPPVSSGTVVQAVVANLTGIAPVVGTYLVAYSASLTKAPGSSDISLRAGEVRGNLIAVELDTTPGAVDGFMELFNSVGSVNAAVDIEGWFQ